MEGRCVALESAVRQSGLRERLVPARELCRRPYAGGGLTRGGMSRLPSRVGSLVTLEPRLDVLPPVAALGSWFRRDGRLPPGRPSHGFRVTGELPGAGLFVLAASCALRAGLRLVLRPAGQAVVASCRGGHS